MLVVMASSTSESSEVSREVMIDTTVTSIFVLTLPSEMGLIGLGRLRAALEDLLGTRVDLVPKLI